MIGFSSSNHELEELREIYKLLNESASHIGHARNTLKRLDLGVTESHLRNAEYYAGKAKEKIASLGRGKNSAK